MLKQTMVNALESGETLPIFVNPHRVAHVYPRLVRQQVGETMVGETKRIQYGTVIKGSLINFGASGDDADVPVLESAEEVAREVADAIDMHFVLDVAARTRELDEIAARRAAKPECVGRECPGCDDCIPF